MPYSALISGFAGLAGKGMDAAFGSSAAEEAFGRQKELMRLQNQYAVQNWNRENEYNTPLAQKKRLLKAGLNPDLIYGNGASGLQAGSIDAPSAPSAPMVPASAPNFGSTMTDAANAALALNQAKKADADAVGQKIENDYLSKTLSDRVAAVGIQNNWTKEQTAKVQMECQNLSAQWNMMQAQIDQIKKQNSLTDKQLSWYDRHMNAEIGHLKSSAAYQNALKGLTDSQKTLLDNTMDSLTRISTAQASQLEALVGLLDKYGDAQTIIGMASQIISSATDILGMFIPSKTISKVIK